MTTRKNLQRLKNIVYEILKDDERTRSSDDLLCLRVYERVSKDADSPVTPLSMTLAYFLQNRKTHGFPPFESVRRARQKLQAEYPELKACEKVEQMRKENEKEYEAFAKDVNPFFCRPVRCIETGEIFPSVSAAAKSLGMKPSSLMGHIVGKSYIKNGIRFEYLEKSSDGTLCWSCANAYGCCSWTGRNEKGEIMFQPVEGWTAIPTTVNIGGYRSERSYHVIECPEYVPEKSGSHG